MRSKIKDPVKQEIKNLVKKTAIAYDKFNKLSEEILTMITPIIREANNQKDEEVILELISITQPFDKNGQKMKGDFVGRFYLYGEFNKIQKAKNEIN